MALIQWNDNLSVKVASFDAEHKKLVAMVNNLHEGMKERRGNQVLGEILQELADYVETHFKHEEELMQKYNYPGFSTHKAEHEKLTAEVQKLLQDFLKGSITLSITVSNFLKDWLQNHIQKTDKQYADFFVEKGVK